MKNVFVLSSGAMNSVDPYSWRIAVINDKKQSKLCSKWSLRTWILFFFASFYFKFSRKISTLLYTVFLVVSNDSSVSKRSITSIPNIAIYHWAQPQMKFKKLCHWTLKVLSDVIISNMYINTHVRARVLILRKRSISLFIFFYRTLVYICVCVCVASWIWFHICFCDCAIIIIKPERLRYFIKNVILFWSLALDWDFYSAWVGVYTRVYICLFIVRLFPNLALAYNHSNFRRKLGEVRLSSFSLLSFYVFYVVSCLLIL